MWMSMNPRETKLLQISISEMWHHTVVVLWDMLLGLILHTKKIHKFKIVSVVLIGLHLMQFVSGVITHKPT